MWYNSNMSEIYTFECAEVSTEVDGDVATIRGTAIPYNTLGHPHRAGIQERLNVVVADTAFGELDDTPGVVFTETHDTSPSNVLASTDAPGPAGKLSFNQTPTGLLFEATMDVSAPKSGQIYSNLRNGVIKGNVSVGFTPLETSNMSYLNSEGVRVEAIRVSEARLDHLAFLGNEPQAFKDAVSLAANLSSNANIKLTIVDDKGNAISEYYFANLTSPNTDVQAITKTTVVTGEDAEQPPAEEIEEAREDLEELKEINDTEDVEPHQDSQEEVKEADPELVSAALAAHKKMMSHQWTGSHVALVSRECARLARLHRLLDD